MRLINQKFHDYYDGILAYGIDPLLIFDRNPVSYLKETVKGSEVWVVDGPNSVPPEALLTIHADLHLVTGSTVHYDGRYWDWGTEVLFVAGVMYPLLRLTETRLMRFNRSNSPAEPDQILYDPQGCTFKFWSRTLEARLQDFFKAPATRYMHELLASRVPLAHIQARKICVNPKLMDFKFQTKVDAYSCGQAIQMFLAAAGSPEKPVAAIADKHRIAAHGFDARSFRKDPSK